MRTILLTVCMLVATVGAASAQPFSFTRTGLAAGGTPKGIAAADFDGDGRLDFAAANFGTPSHDVSVWYGTSAANGGWERPQFIAVGAGPFSIAAADFNHDNHPDLAVAVADADQIVVLRWTPAGFVIHTRIVVQPPANPREVIWADLNRDGNLDLAYTLYERGSVQVSFGHGGVNDFQSATETLVGRGAHGLAAGEIDGDGQLDLVATNALTNQVFVLFSTGGGTFGPEPYPTGNSPRNVTIADFNHDSRPDFAVVNTESNSITMYFFVYDPIRDPDGRLFGGRRDVAVGNSPRDIEAIDANGNGWNDVVITSYGNNRIIVIDGFDLSGEAGGQPPTSFTSQTAPRTMAIGDFNLDGRPDILIGNQGNGAVTLLLNTSPFDGRP